jgi:hypothetical protein
VPGIGTPSIRRGLLRPASRSPPARPANAAPPASAGPFAFSAALPISDPALFAPFISWFLVLCARWFLVLCARGLVCVAILASLVRWGSVRVPGVA